ncbi:hypothetical protein N665_0053s0005 [Sinapis alba]|nr:hypothetical protein N665_0053s0005 [Sinapis alba]
MSPIRWCSLKGKSIATASDSTNSESSDSSLFSIELENREASGHASPDEVEREAENRSAQVTNSAEDADLVDKEKHPTEKEMDFRIADFLPMRLTGTDFEFAEEIDPEKERRFSARKNQKWENHLPTWCFFKSVRKLILQTDPPAWFSFLIPASHRRPWTSPVGYACVYESWFNNCRLWWPLPEFLTTYYSQRKIALGQYTSNGIRIMVTLTVLAAELGIKMSVRLFKELTTPSFTAKIGFFYGKMVPKYNMITRKPLKVKFWNWSYFYVKINEASFEDPSVILNGYFNANIDRLGKWGQGGSDSFQEQVEATRTLTETAVETPSLKTSTKRMDKLNLASLPSYAASIGTPSHGQDGSCGGSRLVKRRRASNLGEGAPNVSPRPSPSPKVLAREHLGDEGDGVVEYPHVIDFRYQHTEVLFVEDHEAPARLFRQIKLKKKGMPELDELSQGGQYQEMTRAGVIPEKASMKESSSFPAVDSTI